MAARHTTDTEHGTRLRVDGDSGTTEQRADDWRPAVAVSAAD